MPGTPRKRKTKIQQKADKLKLPSALPADLSRPMTISKFAAAYSIDPSTVWRELRDGHLKFIVVNKRKLILPPAVQQAARP